MWQHLSQNCSPTPVFVCNFQQAKVIVNVQNTEAVFRVIGGLGVNLDSWCLFCLRRVFHVLLIEMGTLNDYEVSVLNCKSFLTIIRKWNHSTEILFKIV